MTTITTQKRLIISIQKAAFILAILYELQPGKIAAQPVNDNCAAALANPLAPNGNCKYGTVAASTVEGSETFGCMGASTSSVWYSFIATQANMWLSLRPQPTGTYFCTFNFSMRVYRWTGSCTFGGAIACKLSTVYSGLQINNVLNLAGLTPGSTYLVQVTPDATCGNLYPNFCIRLDEPSNCTTCATVCGPMCVWAGPTPPTVPQITSTCPSYGWAPPMNQGDIQTNCFSFTASNDSVYLQQIVYAYCSPGNTISFTYDLYTAGCALIQSGNVFANNLITGLTVGTTYRICYTMQSACSWDSVFWPYAYTTSSALPVELVSFGGVPVKGGNELYWKTASEKNCKEFIIERTIHGGEFEEIAVVKGGGNSTSILKYSALDKNPNVGNNYYRLKQIDFNGEFAYSKLITVKFSNDALAMSIIPNPSKDKATISFNATGKYATFLKITDMQGKTISSRQFVTEEGLNEYSLNMNEFLKGIYSVQLIVDDQNMISKLVKE